MTTDNIHLYTVSIYSFRETQNNTGLATYLLYQIFVEQYFDKYFCVYQVTTFLTVPFPSYLQS